MSSTITSRVAQVRHRLKAAGDEALVALHALERLSPPELALLAKLEVANPRSTPPRILTTEEIIATHGHRLSLNVTLGGVGRRLSFAGPGAQEARRAFQGLSAEEKLVLAQLEVEAKPERVQRHRDLSRINAASHYADPAKREAKKAASRAYYHANRERELERQRRRRRRDAETAVAS